MVGNGGGRRLVTSELSVDISSGLFVNKHRFDDFVRMNNGKTERFQELIMFVTSCITVKRKVQRHKQLEVQTERTDRSLR